MKLQACPRCGVAAILTAQYDYGGKPSRWLYYGHCPNLMCQLMGPQDTFQKRAAEKWNFLRWAGPLEGY